MTRMTKRKRERDNFKENEENYRQRLDQTSLNWPQSSTGCINIREACRELQEKRGRDLQNEGLEDEREGALGGGTRVNKWWRSH